MRKSKGLRNSPNGITRKNKPFVKISGNLNVMDVASRSFVKHSDVCCFRGELRQRVPELVALSSSTCLQTIPRYCIKHKIFK